MQRTLNLHDALLGYVFRTYKLCQHHCIDIEVRLSRFAIPTGHALYQFWSFLFFFFHYLTSDVMDNVQRSHVEFKYCHLVSNRAITVPDITFPKPQNSIGSYH